MKTELRVVEITHNSFTDGPGVRTVVFFKGCPLRCAWCHNPEGQSFSPEMMFYSSRCTECGTCRRACPNGKAEIGKDCTACGTCAEYCLSGARRFVGTLTDTDSVLGDITRYAFLYRDHGGVTFSGGECTSQPDALAVLLRSCRERGIHTAVDTCGFCPPEVLDRILPDTDLFLYDVKTTDPESHKRYTGVGNERILGNLSRLLERGARVWVRMPIIPRVNDRKSEMEALGRFLKEHGSPERVELLPYHRMGERKYKGLGREVPEFEVPTAERMEELRADLREHLGEETDVG